jgi:hypothetical protein
MTRMMTRTIKKEVIMKMMTRKTKMKMVDSMFLLLLVKLAVLPSLNQRKRVLRRRNRVNKSSQVCLWAL